MLCNLSFEVRIFIKLLTVGNCQFSLKKKKKNSVTGLNQAVVSTWIYSEKLHTNLLLVSHERRKTGELCKENPQIKKSRTMFVEMETMRIKALYIWEKLPLIVVCERSEGTREWNPKRFIAGALCFCLQCASMGLCLSTLCRLTPADSRGTRRF